MSLPTIKQLQYFTALEKYLHFGKAAKASHISQSAFSSAIKELEILLGVQLVDRSHKKVIITNIGFNIATQAHLCLRNIEQLSAFAQRSQGELSGPLYLGVIPTIAPFILPALLKITKEKYPNLELYLREDTTENLHQLLMQGKLDLILLALPYDLPFTQTTTLFKDQFLLACHPKNTFLDPENDSLNTLSTQSILLLEDGHCLREHTLEACKLKDLGQINQFAASGLLTLINMVDSDLGITFLTQMMKDSSLLAHTQIKTYPLKKESYRHIGLCYRKGSARTKEFGRLGDLIKSLNKQKKKLQ